MSVRKRGNSWVAHWANSEGKRCQQTFRLKADAQAFERQQKDLKRTGTLFDPQTAKQPLGALFSPWFATKSNLKPKTTHGYHSIWKTVVEPRWGHVRLNAISHGEVKAWVQTCQSSTGKTLGASRTTQGYRVLAMILDHAVEQGHLVKNPARGIPGARKGFLPSVKSSDARNVLRREELKKVALNCGLEEDLILLLGTVGLRFNEAVALKGKDLDLDQGMIRVQRAFSDINGHIIEQTPKNGKERQVPIPNLVRSSLLNRKMQTGPEGYLFTSSNGGPLRNSNFTKRVWKPALKAAGIDKKMTIHDLRHTAASWLVQNGCKISQLSKMLGHSDPSLTLDIYTHLFDGDMEALSEFINRADSA